MNKLEIFVQFFCWFAFLIHFYELGLEFFNKELTTTNIYTEKLTLKNFPIIIKICIDPSFNDINYGYHHPQEFIQRQDTDGRYTESHFENVLLLNLKGFNVSSLRVGNITEVINAIMIGFGDKKTLDVPPKNDLFQ